MFGVNQSYMKCVSFCLGLALAAALACAPSPALARQPEATTKSNPNLDLARQLNEAFVQDFDQSRTPLGVASRFATAIGILAIVAFVFFVLLPKSQESDATELAASERRTLPSSAGAAKIAPEESQTLLKKFVQWEKRH